jgi:hypothetical protein
MEQFSEDIIKIIDIRVSQGIIKSNENELVDDQDLFYWANFVPHFDNKKFIIIGECGFHTKKDKFHFIFNYNQETDTVTFDQHYKKCICSKDFYDAYSKNIRYNKRKSNEELILPWIRLPKTKEGVVIPLLIERIFGRIPKKMNFIKYTF